MIGFRALGMKLQLEVYGSRAPWVQGGADFRVWYIGHLHPRRFGVLDLSYS